MDEAVDRSVSRGTDRIEKVEKGSTGQGGKTSSCAFGEGKRRYRKGPVVGTLPDCRPTSKPNCILQVRSLLLVLLPTALYNFH